MPRTKLWRSEIARVADVDSGRRDRPSRAITRPGPAAALIAWYCVVVSERVPVKDAAACRGCGQLLLHRRPLSQGRFRMLRRLRIVGLEPYSRLRGRVVRQAAGARRCGVCMKRTDGAAAGAAPEGCCGVTRELCQRTATESGYAGGRVGQIACVPPHPQLSPPASTVPC
jgi:hypothetical protein